jgi:hypothetical protein
MERTMTPKDTPTDKRPSPGHSLKRKPHAKKQAKKSASRQKSRPAAPVARPECILIGGQGSCPEWEELLVQYPMIDSVQREDFPDHDASFVYLAHFYRTDNTPEESSRAKKEFRGFFRAIGYTYDSSGDFESRWFEGVGIHIR